MSSWFDKLLEELQRRQEEADAQREGRPLPPRERAERDVTPIGDARRRRRASGGNGADDGGGGSGGRVFPPVAGGGDIPWRRY